MSHMSKRDAAAYKTNADGSKHLRGHYAVDKHDHLVLLPPGAELGEGMRWATEGDHERKEQAERARKAAEAAPEEATTGLEAVLQRIATALDAKDAKDKLEG